MRASLLALLLATATTFFTGCAVQTGAGDEEGTVDQGEQALATKSLVGTWEAVSGPIYRIEFTAERASTLGGWTGRAFNATVDNGVRCITTPCPSTDEVAGVYRVSFGTQVTFASYDRSTATFGKYLGDYSMSLAKDGTLTLTKKDGTFTSVLRKAASGVKCGTTVCGAGLVCCNPLMNICTRPGEFCIL